MVSRIDGRTSRRRFFVLSPSVKTFAQDKKGTCEFGADDQKLKGAERKKFIARCMAKEDAPAKKKPKAKKKKKSRNRTSRKDG